MKEKDDTYQEGLKEINRMIDDKFLTVNEKIEMQTRTVDMMKAF